MVPLLEIKNLTVSFNNNGRLTSAVNNVSFCIPKGKIVALVGESGSGKSVTSMSILRLLPKKNTQYESGEILFSHDGLHQVDLLKVGDDKLRQIRGHRIAMIFQEPMTALNPVFTCGNQLVEAIKTHKKVSKTQALSEALEWFKKVKLPTPYEVIKKYPHELSGGQKQRVMIAMAMCCNPSLLICDEPTTALDVTVQKSILELIVQLGTENNMGVLFITHDLGIVHEIAHELLVMQHGNVVEQGNAKNILSNPAHPYTKALLACRPGKHSKGNRLPVIADFLKPAQEKKNTITGSNIISNDIALRVCNLSVSYEKKRGFLQKKQPPFLAVNNVSFDVLCGETLGLVGESGCGKTTIGRSILRLIPASAGSIFFGKQDLLKMDEKELKDFRKEVQIVFQDPFSSLNPRLHIGSAIEEPVLVHKIVETRTQSRELVKKLLTDVNLDAGYYPRYPHELSGGQRQRIVIARALALNPSFVIFDESVSALDVSVQAQVLNLINDLKKEYGLTIIFISHDLSVIRYMCDRVLVMNKGEVVESGTVEEVYQNPKQEYTRKLLASVPK